MSLRSIDHVSSGYLCVNYLLFVVRNTLKVEFWRNNPNLIITGFCLRIACIARDSNFISSFDGDGMAYLNRDSYQFSILEGSWQLTTRCEVFQVWHISVTLGNMSCGRLRLLPVRFFFLKSFISVRICCLDIALSLVLLRKCASRTYRIFTLLNEVFNLGLYAN